jgi:hypothetical protein
VLPQQCCNEKSTGTDEKGADVLDPRLFQRKCLRKSNGFSIYELPCMFEVWYRGFGEQQWI